MRIGTKILIAVLATLLSYTAGTWATLFYLIIDNGEYLLYEPNVTCLLTEFFLASVISLLGIITLIWLIIKEFRNE
jgi:hypothetical protein